MSKRAIRRSHLSRIRAKFREVAKKWWPKSPTGKKIPWRDGGNTRYDRDGWLDKEAARLANHHNHHCQLCKKPRYEREQYDPLEELEKDEYEE